MKKQKRTPADVSQLSFDFDATEPEQVGKPLSELRYEIEMGLAVYQVPDGYCRIWRVPGDKEEYIYTAYADYSFYSWNDLVKSLGEGPLWSTFDNCDAHTLLDEPTGLEELDETPETPESFYTSYAWELTLTTEPSSMPFQNSTSGETWRPCMVIDGPTSEGYGHHNRVVCDAGGALELLSFLKEHEQALQLLFDTQKPF